MYIWKYFCTHLSHRNPFPSKLAPESYWDDPNSTDSFLPFLYDKAPATWNQPYLQLVLISFSSKWSLRFTDWVLGCLFHWVCHCLPGAKKPRTGVGKLFCKGPVVSILGFAGCVVSVTTVQLCHCNLKTDTGNM